MTFIKDKGYGLLLCLVIALPMWLLTKNIHALEIVGAPILAILVGMLLPSSFKEKALFSNGVKFTSKKILQGAVVFLGFGLNLATVGKIGSTSLPIILSTITTSLLVAWLVNKIAKVPYKTATLIGIGSSICGGSAIAASAPVINANEEEIAQSISVIFLFNVIAAFIFPTLGGLLGLSNTGFGLFAGTAINDTSSVTAAASTWDTLHQTGGSVLEYATIVKLTRTLAIIPITLGLSIIELKKKERKPENMNQEIEELTRDTEEAVQSFSLKKVFPMFILYFVLASLLTTIVTGLLTGDSLIMANSVFAFLKQVSKFMIVMAMAAIGLNTNVVKLIKNGSKPLILGFCCWVAITIVSLSLQQFLGLI